MQQIHFVSSDEVTSEPTLILEPRSYQKPDYTTTSIAIMTLTGSANNDDGDSTAS